MKLKTIILIIILLASIFFIPKIVNAADIVTLSAEHMIEPIQTEVYHIVIETEDSNKPSTIRGRLHNARINQIWVWQIENTNGTGQCQIRLYEFECSFTADRLMPAEITVSYSAPKINQGCYVKPTSLALEYEKETYSAESAILPIEDYCVLLPMVKG